ncbi:MAG: hypothetical protein M1269_06030 [Chloroflexi bacterium]|nr:hypothetical protein [Chloroflexota bacterium]
MTKSDVILVTNSPGELCSWVRVTADRLKMRSPDLRVVVMLVPCPYATGKEEEIAKGFPSVDMVTPPSQFLRLMLGLSMKDYRPSSRGVVVFLGGDFWHASLAARRLKFPAMAYAVRPASALKKFSCICLPREDIKKDFINSGIKEEKIRVVGNLMVEGVRPRKDKDELREIFGIKENELVVGILPGSRLYHVQVSLPVYLRVAEEISHRVEGVRFMVGLSPFISVEDMEKCLGQGRDIQLGGVGGELIEDSRGKFIRTFRGLEVRLLIDRQYDLMKASDLVMTIPGTNTAELATLGIPMVVSYSWNVKIPGGGLGMFLGGLPPGNTLRKIVLSKVLEKLKFTALPNQFADKMIIPEVRVNNCGSEITPAIIDLLGDPERRRRISGELVKIMGETGAADRLADLVINEIEKQNGKGTSVR